MRYLSLCSGIEAASVAWEPLGWQRLSHRILPPALHRQQLRVALRRELEAEARAVREYTRCSLGQHLFLFSPAGDGGQLRDGQNDFENEES